MRSVLPLLFLALAGRALLGPPAESDVPFPPAKLLGCLLLFLSWLASLGCWGRWLRSRIGVEESGPGLDFALGFGLAACAGGMLGALGCIGFAWAPLAMIFALAGAFLAPPIRAPRLPSWEELPFALVFGVLALVTLRAQSFWDPLWYHLNAPRSWVEAGRIFFNPDETMAYDAGAWDNLYVWAHLLCGGAQGRGLIAAQLFAQWQHLAAFCALAGVFRTFCRRLGASILAARLATLAALLPAPLLFTATLAKNDWGANLWFFSGVLLLLGSRPPAALLAGGALLGLAFTAKMTVGLTLVPLLVALWFLRALSPRNFPPVAAGFVAGALPVLARNYFGTGNPLYPALPSLSPGLVPPALRQGLTAVAGAGFAPWPLIKELAAISPFFFVALAALLFPGRKKETRALALVCVASFLLLGVLGGANTLLRWWGPGLMLASALLFLELGMPGARTAFAIGLCLVLYAPLPWAAAIGALRFVDPAIQIRLHPAGQALAWIRMNQPNAKVAVLNDLRLYYLRPVRFVRIWDSVSLSEQLRDAKSAKDLLSALDRAGFTLLLDSVESLDQYNFPGLVEQTREAIAAHPEALVFSDASGRVASVRLLLVAQARQDETR